MQQNVAETNPFKKLAEQEREQEQEQIHLDNGSTHNNRPTGSHNLSLNTENIRPPIPFAPSLLTSPTSPSSYSDDGYANVVDTYAEDDDNDDESNEDEATVDNQTESNTNGHTSSSSTSESASILRPMNIENPIGSMKTSSNISSPSSPIQYTYSTPSQPPYKPPQNTEQVISSGNQSPIANVMPVVFPEHQQHTPSTSTGVSSQNDTTLNSESLPPVQPTRPPVLPRRRPSNQRVSSLDPGSISTVSSHSFHDDQNESGYGQHTKPKIPHRLPPVRTDLQVANPKLPTRRRLPGTTSSVSQSAATPTNISTPIHSTQIIPPIPPVKNYLPGNQSNSSTPLSNTINTNLSNAPPASDTTPIALETPIIPTPDFSTPTLLSPVNLQDEFGSFQTAILPNHTSSSSPVQFATQDSNLPHPSTPVGRTDSRASLPTITVSTPEAPTLPKKPQLPKRPPRLSSGSQSAYELLENYGRRTSLTSANTTPDRNNSITSHSPNISQDNSMMMHDDLDLESLKSLGITEEMIRQQREIEERIQRENSARRQAQELQTASLINPTINITPAQNHDTPITSSSSIVSGVSSISPEGDGDNVPDDVSQLEIPTNLSRTNSFSGDNSDNQSTVSSIHSSPDFSETGDMTEEEFVSLLPPVPKYTEHANDTEISIPDGKAINMSTINESHPKEDPPEYTPVSDALKKIINRPQFSQTGGDSLSIRRQQQEQQRLQQAQAQAQSQQHHHHQHHRHYQQQQQLSRPDPRRRAHSTGTTTTSRYSATSSRTSGSHRTGRLSETSGTHRYNRSSTGTTTSTRR